MKQDIMGPRTEVKKLNGTGTTFNPLGASANCERGG